MSFWDYALLAAIGGYMAWLLFRPKRRNAAAIAAAARAAGDEIQNDVVFSATSFLRPFAQIAEGHRRLGSTSGGVLR